MSRVRLPTNIRRDVVGCLSGVLFLVTLSITSCGSQSPQDAESGAAGGDVQIEPGAARRLAVQGGVLATSTGTVKWNPNVCESGASSCERTGFGITMSLSNDDNGVDFSQVVPLPELPSVPTNVDRVMAGGTPEGYLWSIWSLPPGFEIEVVYTDTTTESVATSGGGYVALVTRDDLEVAAVSATDANGTRDQFCNAPGTCGHLSIGNARPVPNSD